MKPTQQLHDLGQSLWLDNITRGLLTSGMLRRYIDDLSRLSPNAAVAIAARVKLAGQEFVGEQRELYLLEERPEEEAPYERLLGDAMAGDGALFTREDAVEAAWAVVDPVLKKHPPARPYKHGSWGPKEADAILAPDGGWHNPTLSKASRR